MGVTWYVILFCVNGWALQTHAHMRRVFAVGSFERGASALGVACSSVGLLFCTLKLISIAIS